MRKLLIAAVAAAALGAAAPALAGMAKADTNGDGKVSLQEMQQQQLMRTMRLDANGDGKLSKAEFIAAMTQRLQAKGKDPAQAQAKAVRMFAKFDLNADGFVGADEIRHATARRFARMDIDRSGYVPATAGHRSRMAATADGGGYVPAPPAPAQAQAQPQAPSATPH